MALQRKPEEHENHERWLVSYADFITLLFAFFVVLYAISQVDVDKLKRLAGSLSTSFESPGGDPRPGGGAGPDPDAHADGGSMQPAAAHQGPEEAGGGIEQIVSLRQILDEVSVYIKENALEDTVRLQIQGSDLLIAFNDRELFGPGTSELSQPGGAVLARVGASLSQLKNPLRLRARATPSGVGAARSTPFGLAGARLEAMSGFLSARLHFSPYRFSLLVYGDHGGNEVDWADETMPLPQPGWIEVVVGPPVPERRLDDPMRGRTARDERRASAPPRTEAPR